MTRKGREIKRGGSMGLERGKEVKGWWSGFESAALEVLARDRQFES